MKRFVIRLLVFLAIMFLLDRGFGLAMKYLQDHAKGGYVKHHNYILHQANEDILIFGSSRAIHHYNPQIIEDSLGLSCYNCGQDGNGIVLFYGWWQMLKERHVPKIIIYEITPDFDVKIGDDNNRYLGWLRSEYDNRLVQQIFEDIDSTEKYKMQSMMYRYNSKFLQNITDYIHPLFHISPNGYLPAVGELDTMKIKKPEIKENIIEYDSLKLKYVEYLIKDCMESDVTLVFAVSPLWYGMDISNVEPITSLCYKYGIPLYDYSNDKRYVGQNKYFKDGMHLNERGADYYTSNFCSKLKLELKNRK